MWMLLLFLIGCRPPEAVPESIPEQPDVRPVDPALSGRRGILAPGEGLPVVMTTRGAVYYAMRADGSVEWSYLPIERPTAHAIMGLRVSPRGGEELTFERHARGVLAVLPSRDHRGIRD